MFIPDSKMVFVVDKIKEGDDVVNIPDVLQPAYIYNVGDEIQYSDVLDEDHIIHLFKVSMVKHEVEQSFISSEQTIVVYLELIRE